MLEPMQARKCPVTRPDGPAPANLGGRRRIRAPRARRALLACVLASVGLAAHAGSAAAQFSAQPVILELRTGDSTATTTFAVRNESADPMRFRIYAGDYDQSGSGKAEFLPAGTHPRTCVGRLRFLPDHLALAPKEIGEVQVLMEPGDSTCWSLIFVETRPTDARGIRIAQRIGVKVYGVSRDARPAGDIRAVRVEADTSSGARQAVIEFENSGARPLRPEGEIEVRTAEGDVVAVVPVPVFSVLPGRERETRVALDVSLPAGSYLAIPILDFGGDYLAGGQAAFRVEDP